MVTPGTIIYLNGTSSAGKTTLAQALQERLPAPYVHVSLDSFTQMFPGQYVAVIPFDHPIPPLAREGILLQHEMRDGRLIMENPLGPVARRFLTGFRHAIRALASTGNNVIVDDVLEEPELRAECVTVLTGLPLLFVGVRCPTAIIAQRERERGDRLLGLAAWQAERVHTGALYDVEVDTSLLNPDECVERVIACLKDPPTPTAFERMRQALAEERR